jgi:hypothetical protein
VSRTLRHRYGRSHGPFKVGDRIVMRAGTRVGMAKLRADTTATIDQIQTAADGTAFYGVWWIDAKGKRRTTWWAP